MGAPLLKSLNTYQGVSIPKLVLWSTLSPFALKIVRWAMMEHGKTTFYLSTFAVVYYLVVLLCVHYFCCCMNIHVRCMYVGNALQFVTLSMTNLIHIYMKLFTVAIVIVNLHGLCYYI